MLLAGILGDNYLEETSEIIHSILCHGGKKVSITKYKALCSKTNDTIRSYITELNKTNTDILIVKVKAEDFKTACSVIKFDYLICNCVLPKNIKKYLKSNGTAIINIDDYADIAANGNLDEKLVTFGFSSKASITTSSISEVINDGVLCCLKKTMLTNAGNYIEPQEFCMKVDKEGVNPYSILAAAAFAILNDINVNCLVAKRKPDFIQ